MQKEASISLKIIITNHSQNSSFSSLKSELSTFTCLISDEERFVFLDSHLNRLLRGADHLFPELIWSSKKNEILTFLQTQFVPSHYFRLEIQNDSLLFAKKPHAPKAAFLSAKKAVSHKGGAMTPAYIKSPNYQVAELEIREATKEGFDDVIFFDFKNHLTEASTSNIFIVTSELKIITPEVSSNVLAGVTREKLILFLKTRNLSVSEGIITDSMLESSKEIWFTNAIQGLRKISDYQGLKFNHNKTMYDKVCEDFGRFGEKFNIYE
jgi:4-amino-4-deoxychorismate lyase